MAGAAVRGRLSWAIADVIGLIDEGPRARSIVLAVPGWEGHLPGQHVDIRLTAEDGYQAQRSYSIATPEDADRVTLTVEEVVDGEVSPYLITELREGDQIEVRGPIGGYFVWEQEMGGPVQLIGGGSGVVPLMAMLRFRVGSGSDIPFRYLSSARNYANIFYREELEKISENEGVEVVHTLTRTHPEQWSGPKRRVDREMLEELVWDRSDQPRIYACGPTGFVETVASHLVDLGHHPDRIRTERFGPSGG